jgi:hypothetical protein
MFRPDAPIFDICGGSEGDLPNLACLIVALMHQSGKTFSYEVESF